MSYKLKELNGEQIKKYLSSFSDDNQATHLYESRIEKNPKILDMAKIPFLLNIIAEKLTQNPNEPLPENRGMLIEEFVEEIIRKKPRKDIKAPSVPKNDKYRFLGLLAFHMVEANDVEGEYSCSFTTKDEVGDIWNKISGTETRRILLRSEKERLLRSGSSDGESSFAHALIRDYFVARHIKHSVHREKQNIIEKIKPYLEYRKFDSPISLLIGIVTDEESEDIMELLADVDPHFAAECFMTAKKVSAAIVPPVPSKVTESP